MNNYNKNLLNNNFNNQNKHWILVILEKIKRDFLCICRFVSKCLTHIGNFLKKIWKILLVIVILALIVYGGIEGYGYYKNTYFVKKL